MRAGDAEEEGPAVGAKRVCIQAGERLRLAHLSRLRVVNVKACTLARPRGRDPGNHIAVYDHSSPCNALAYLCGRYLLQLACVEVGQQEPLDSILALARRRYGDKRAPRARRVESHRPD